MKYDLVIFDLDGTLMDTSKSITKTVNSAMEELRKKQYSIDECVKFVGGGVSGLARNILGKEKYTDVTNEEMEKVIRKYYDIYFDYGVEPYEEIPELLDFLEQNGVKKGIVTNKDHETALSAVDKKLSNLTGFPEYRLVWRIVRQRVVDDVASVLDIDYLDKTLVPSLTREIAEQSIYAYLEEELGLRIAYAQKEITIDPATNRDQILMDIGTDQHVVSVKSKVYLADGQQFQFTDSRHKLEKFRFIDFAKRQKR